MKVLYIFIRIYTILCILTVNYPVVNNELREGVSPTAESEASEYEQ